MLKHIKHHHDFMWRYLIALLKSFLRPSTIFLFFLSTTMIFISAGLFYFLEKGENPHLLSFLDSVYFTVTTTTGVGFGDITPISNAGKILAMFMMIIGTGFFVSFTAIIATSLMDIEKQRKL